MSLLAEISDVLIAVRLVPQYLYIQRHLHNKLLQELAASTGDAAVDEFVITEQLFGLSVVWVQSTNHPNVRAI